MSSPKAPKTSMLPFLHASAGLGGDGEISMGEYTKEMAEMVGPYMEVFKALLPPQTFDALKNGLDEGAARASNDDKFNITTANALEKAANYVPPEKPEVNTNNNQNNNGGLDGGQIVGMRM